MYRGNSFNTPVRLYLFDIQHCFHHWLILVYAASNN